MIVLVEFAVDTAETFNESRRKMLRLAKRLGYDAIGSSRLTTAFSEIVRPLAGRPPVTVRLGLTPVTRGYALAATFFGARTPARQVGRFFDWTQELDDSAGFQAFRYLPDQTLEPSPDFLDELREMLAKPSREELLLALKRQNDALGGEIAERRRTEEALRHSESRIQAVLEGTPDPLILVDREGRLIYLNSQAEKTFGYARDELLGRSVDALVPMERRPDHARRVREFVLQGRTLSLGMDAGLEAVCKDGRRIAIDLKLSPIAGESGPQVIAAIRDVTEQKKALDAVRKLSLAVEQSPVAVAITDRQGNIEYVNPAFLSTTGYAAEELIGQNPRLLKSGRTPAEVYASLWDTIGSGGTWRGTLVNRKKNGEEFWESTVVAPIFGDKGAITHFVAVKEDISERIRAEEELKRQRALLDTLVNALPLAVFAKDVEGRFQVANDFFCALLGRKRQEVSGLTARDVFDPDTARHIERIDCQTLVESGVVTEEDWRSHPDGSLSLYHMIRAPIRDEKGSVTGLVGAYIDITERKKAEDAIRAAQAEMTLIFNTAASGMRVLDTNFTVRKVNDAFVALSGFSREEVVGHKCHEFFDGGDCHTEDCPLARILAGEERVEGMVIKAHRDGTPIYCEMTATRHLSPDGELLGIIEDFRDVTERMKAQHLLRQSETKYRELVESASSIILKLDMRGNITFFNEFAQKFFGFSADEVVGRSIVGTIVPHSESGGRDLDALLQDIIRHPERYEKNENENICKDGGRVWVSWTNQVVRDDITGQARELLCIGQDASARKKAQDALEDAMDVISGSIRYASRIQRAVLPTGEDFAAAFSRHFIVWTPRDVVGGDIYWTAKWGEGALFVLGDCTGHGVPGAFMTLISTGALSRALGEVEPGRPGPLMRRAHQLVQTSLNQHVDGGDSDDGMELGMCYLEPGAEHLIFVGARFPLFVVTGKDILEIKPDRKGIGYRGLPYDPEFTEHRLALEPGLRLYMVSDGVFDQVGGEKRRGFGKNRFKELLASLADVPFEEHGERIYQALCAYQGDESRRDDVSIMGLEY